MKRASKWLGRAQPPHHSGFHCLLIGRLCILHAVCPLMACTHLIVCDHTSAVVVSSRQRTYGVGEGFWQGHALQNSGAEYEELKMTFAQPNLVHLRFVLIGWGTDASTWNKNTFSEIIRGIDLCIFFWRNTAYNNNNHMILQS